MRSIAAPGAVASTEMLTVAGVCATARPELAPTASAIARTVPNVATGTGMCV